MFSDSFSRETFVQHTAVVKVPQIVVQHMKKEKNND